MHHCKFTEEYPDGDSPTMSLPTDKTELYDQLGISLAYDPDGTVTVESWPRGVNRSVRFDKLRGILNAADPHNDDRRSLAHRG